MFHNHEYRFILRSPGEYQNSKGLTRCKFSVFNKRYEQLKNEFIKHGLAIDGFSVEHTRLIEKVFKFKRNSLTKEYHK